MLALPLRIGKQPSAGLLLLLVLLRPMQIEAVVSQRFGSAACRIFRLLQQKKCLEQKQVLFGAAPHPNALYCTVLYCPELCCP